MEGSEGKGTAVQWAEWRGEQDRFLDLYLRGPLHRRPNLRQALIDRASSPWHNAAEREEGRRAQFAEKPDVILFDRDESNEPQVPSAELMLLAVRDGYWVCNIVPRQIGQFTSGEYNSVLGTS